MTRRCVLLLLLLGEAAFAFIIPTQTRQRNTIQCRAWVQDDVAWTIAAGAVAYAATYSTDGYEPHKL